MLTHFKRSSLIKTRTKIVHKNVSQGYGQFLKEKITKPLHNIKMGFKFTLNFMKNLRLHNISI